MTIEDTIHAYYTAYNACDEAALAGLLHPDVVLRSAMGEQRGREAYLATYRYMFGAFVDRMTPEAIRVEGDVAVVAIHDSLTARADIADFMGRPVAQDEEIVLRLEGRYRVVDGRIVAIEIAPAG
ncbi:MAG: nuclear transport factor 2 family protein [Pseudomonadota bacterium]|uniref:nuclear transport factor 2 family protein n=1 Tax=Rhizorhabdus phycosphaerae TaxID=2711156 RepID=UPI0013EC29C7|nr:nuclear transport factor 2 family protein [Rhizorhabdus phycosphaerae]